MNVESYKKAIQIFLSGDYSVETFFKQNNYFLEHAYCKMLKGDLDSAEIEFAKLNNFDNRANWASKLISIIKSNIDNMPTYFQIRNFLEIDLNLLLIAGQAQFIENIINTGDLLYTINPESYKFIARVMFNNDFTDVSLYYLQKAKDKFYYDPEMHLMLANCYLKKGEIESAKKSLLNCLNILPEYFPAKKLLDSFNC